MPEPDAPVPPPARWTLPKLRIDRNGDWFDGDVQITHPGILADLRATLKRDAGGYFIQTQVRIPVVVEDAPCVVVRVERQGEALRGVLNDGAEVVIDPATLRIGDGEVPYCAVRDGAFEARLARAAAFQLLQLAEYDERSGRGTLRLAGREYVLRRAG
jgi:hypothetical protein